MMVGGESRERVLRGEGGVESGEDMRVAERTMVDTLESEGEVVDGYEEGNLGFLEVVVPATGGREYDVGMVLEGESCFSDLSANGGPDVAGSSMDVPVSELVVEWHTVKTSARCRVEKCLLQECTSGGG